MNVASAEKVVKTARTAVLSDPNEVLPMIAAVACVTDWVAWSYVKVIFPTSFDPEAFVWMTGSGAPVRLINSETLE